MGCENRNHIHLGQSMLRCRYFMYRNIKHLHLNKAADFFACLNAVGFLWGTDLMGHGNTWKFM
jgi:hypothetical protein